MADNVPGDGQGEGSLVVRIFYELFGSPLNLTLLGVCAFLIYKIVASRRPSGPTVAREPELPPLKKQDFTLEQLREYDGKGSDGRVLIAVNGKVFDVTRGKRFYGPGGPYGLFAGHDASRALATFSLGEDALKSEYDDLSDLNSLQMESVREWEMQFQEKYIYVGKLLKPGEQPTEYSDTEDEEKTETEKKAE
ncbi:membrane-associated progesterone receptor component 1-like [Plakobranchus ocellatus]|uniref:Membrane-associated progesterone receptor component 1-like n=1 Tax=Plakobranchus ocellatus TaxID=259542 RepID=A0AAV3YNV1_9GAST|nr:membrane-associated progesterone receptor component 1-like [Plakobranchus ocellatus]